LRNQCIEIIQIQKVQPVFLLPVIFLCINELCW